MRPQRVTAVAAAVLALSAAVFPAGAPAAHAAEPPVVTNGSAPAVAVNVDGRAEVFVVGRDGAAYHVWDEEAGADRVRWSGWNRLDGVRLTDGLAAIRLNDDNLVVVGRRTGDGAVVYNRRHCWFGTVWCGWKVLSNGAMIGTPSLVTDAHSYAKVVVRGLDNRVYFAGQSGRGYDDWSGWNIAGGVPGTHGTPTVINQHQGHPVIFMAGPGGQAFVSTFNGSEFNLASRLQPFEKHWTGSGRYGAALMRTRNGERVPVVMASTSWQALFTRSFHPIGTNLGWTSWARTPGDPSGDLSGVTDHADGAAVMYGRFADFTYRRIRVTDGGLSGWAPIPNGTFSGDPVALSLAGRHWVFGRGMDGRVYFTQETAARQATWANWQLVSN
ncbi:hypothetical protein [Paractinoplanes rishiriensis]|uniref:PLL-like beta propeller domain-containing protein n=1 Tax=Paractinoplanes rishiriensis TaxID=1050105 RepID=A0A919N0P1_9ACTN|nr:hypothetical protein [Actinoplanes rishiriensis]GIE99875.1 hypothetical protein Ari01nite_73400 [Actinoplanes rishiriensis]